MYVPDFITLLLECPWSLMAHYSQIFICVSLLIAQLLQGVGSFARELVNHTSWTTEVTLTDRPMSIAIIV